MARGGNQGAPPAVKAGAGKRRSAVALDDTAGCSGKFCPPCRCWGGTPATKCGTALTELLAQESVGVPSSPCPAAQQTKHGAAKEAAAARGEVCLVWPNIPQFPRSGSIKRGCCAYLGHAEHLRHFVWIVHADLKVEVEPPAPVHALQWRTKPCECKRSTVAVSQVGGGSWDGDGARRRGARRKGSSSSSSSSTRTGGLGPWPHSSRPVITEAAPGLRGGWVRTSSGSKTRRKW